MPTAHAFVVHAPGGPEVLSYEEVQRPEPADGEVLIEVRAASVNPVDWKIRSGSSPRDFPAVIGYDASGTVVESRAEGFAPGDEVFGRVEGAYAEYTTAEATAIARKPDSIDHIHAAALPVAGITAWQALFDKGGLERGQTALVQGAAGGVGHLGVQFAKVAGARVIGTGSTRNREFVLGLGADEYIDYTTQDVSSAATDVDVAFGGDATAQLVPTLREGGIIVTIASAPPVEEAAARGARAELLVAQANTEQLERIAELVAAGDVRVEIAETLPLSEVARAHELSESGHVRGKIVLTVSA